MATKRRRKALGHWLKVQVWDKTLGRCWYCGTELTRKAEWSMDKPNIDHVIPVCDGGGDDLENLVYACFRCNSAKSGHSVETLREEWAEMILFSAERLGTLLSQYEGMVATGVCEDVIVQAKRFAGEFTKMRMPFYGEVMDMEWSNYVI